MPEFNPGVQKTAVVEMTNPTGIALDYRATLYMGAGMTPVSTTVFGLNAGEASNIQFPVTMPLEPGSYPVFFIVWSNSVQIGTYRATEDIVILPSTDYPALISYTPLSSYHEGRLLADVSCVLPPSGYPKPIGYSTAVALYLMIPGSAMPLRCDGAANVDTVIYTRLFGNCPLCDSPLDEPSSIYNVGVEADIKYIDCSAPSEPVKSYARFLPPGTYPLYFIIAFYDTYGTNVEYVNVRVSDLVVSAGCLSNFVYSELEALRGVVYTRNGSSFKFKVTNNGTQVETHKIWVWRYRTGSTPGSHWNRDSSILIDDFDVTLAPGASIVLQTRYYMGDDGYTYCHFAVDDAGGKSDEGCVIVY